MDPNFEIKHNFEPRFQGINLEFKLNFKMEPNFEMGPNFEVDLNLELGLRP
jgi:hypothetical protein